MLCYAQHTKLASVHRASNKLDVSACKIFIGLKFEICSGRTQINAASHQLFIFAATPLE